MSKVTRYCSKVFGADSFHVAARRAQSLKTGQRTNQSRPLGVETGHYRRSLEHCKNELRRVNAIARPIALKISRSGHGSFSPRAIKLPPSFLEGRVETLREGKLECPACSKCGGQTGLRKIEADKPHHDKRTFECAHCGHEETQVVKYR